MEGKDLYIRSSSAEFLIFEEQTHASGGIEVRSMVNLKKSWMNYLINRYIIK